MLIHSYQYWEICEKYLSSCIPAGCAERNNKAWRLKCWFWNIKAQVRLGPRLWDLGSGQHPSRRSADGYWRQRSKRRFPSHLVLRVSGRGTPSYTCSTGLQHRTTQRPYTYRIPRITDRLDPISSHLIHECGVYIKALDQRCGSGARKAVYGPLHQCTIFFSSRSFAKETSIPSQI